MFYGRCENIIRAVSTQRSWKRVNVYLVLRLSSIFELDLHSRHMHYLQSLFRKKEDIRISQKNTK